MIKPNNRAFGAKRKTCQPGLWPDGNTPLSPPAAVLLHGKASHVIFRSLSLPYKSRSLATPEGKVCSMLNINLIRYEQHYYD